MNTVAQDIIEIMQLALNRQDEELTDIGNDVGIAIARHLRDKDGMAIADFIRGVNHGIGVVQWYKEHPESPRPIWIKEVIEPNE